MIIRFQIIKSVVMASVKASTYIKGKMDQAADEKAAKMAYQETAGDEEVHESVLTHDFQTALELLKTMFVDYIVPTPQTIGDNVIFYGDKGDEGVEFVLDVSKRYNGTLTDTLARLSAKYVEDYMTYQWWLKTNNMKQAEPYVSAIQMDEVAIRKCFVMSGPSIPKVPYSSTLTASVDGEGVSGEVRLEMGENATLSYSLDNGAIDDIEAHSDHTDIVEVHRCLERRAFTLVPRNTGFTKVRLFSRHNDKLKFECDTIVTEEEGYGV